jgi:hypothetical protein
VFDICADPILVVGDLNANTFEEIRGILQAGSSKAFSDKLLVLDYRPLASDGAGNIPVFGEFFTRGLLSLSPEWQAGFESLISNRAELQSPSGHGAKRRARRAWIPPFPRSAFDSRQIWSMFP